MRIATVIALCAIAGPTAALAEVVVANRTIRAHETIGPGDLTIAKGDLPGTYQDPDALTGLEARVVLYAGRPVRQGDLGPAAVVERNQVVPMRYLGGGIEIMTEGRALQRAAVGETIRVMNLSSRTTVSGQVAPDGSIQIIE